MVGLLGSLAVIALLGGGTAHAAPVLVGEWLVADPDANAIYRLDPNGGTPVVISEGGLFRQPTGVAIDAEARIWVADPELNAILRVDAADGSQTVVSSGGDFRWPMGVAVDGSGDLIVTDPDADAVFRVDPSTGQQTLELTAADAGVLYASGVTVEASSDPVLADPDAAALRRWDSGTSMGSTVSAGGSFLWPSDVTRDDQDDLLVTDPDANAFFRVDPVAGSQSLEGPAGAFLYPTGIAYVPEPGGVALVAGAVVLVGLDRRRRSRRDAPSSSPSARHDVAVGAPHVGAGRIAPSHEPALDASSGWTPRDRRGSA